ncbi:MAG: CrcB family protein [Phycisphaerae bacterium]|jgi:CrcB protein|nr:CrcB family protein [Phycisphaerae bacterium]
MSLITMSITFGGGAVGSVLRHLVVVLFAGRFGRHAWVALAIVNITGCVAIGLVERWITAGEGLLGMSPQFTRWTFSTGLLGGYTSFSALSVLSDRLWTEGRRWTAVVQTMLPIALALPAVWLGAAVGGWLVASFAKGVAP